MPIPETAKRANETIDPADIVDFVVNMTKLLEDGEEFSSMLIEAYPESAALGFRILSVAPYAPVALSNGRVRIFVTVQLANQEDAVFAQGKSMGVKVTAVTNSAPTRQYQRSAAIPVGQR